MIYPKEEVLNGAAKAAETGQPPTNVRRMVLGLTVAAYMITYMDRVVMSAAVPSIQKEVGFSLITMGWIISSFPWAYAIFQIPGGWLGDRFGPRRTVSRLAVWRSVCTSLARQPWNAVCIL